MAYFVDSSFTMYFVFQLQYYRCSANKYQYDKFRAVKSTGKNIRENLSMRIARIRLRLAKLIEGLGGGGGTPRLRNSLDSCKMKS